jgi:hypothetical protein
MSYDPSHRRPPRQDRWPNATPQQAWPAYSGADTYREAAGYRGYREVAGGYEGGAYEGGAYEGGGADGYWNGNGYDRGYSGGTAGYDAWEGSYGGYAGAPDDFGGPEPVEYLEPAPTGALLIAPDTLAAQVSRERAVRDRDRPRGGLVAGAVTGLLAAAVAIGAATLAAAFVRPQASPVIAVGGAFIDRTPMALKNFAVEHFGENDKTALLLGMYAGIAVLAMLIGCLARRNPAIGVAGIATFGLFGAFVAITRPESNPTDVIPSVIGGLAGIVAFAWLAWASAPVASGATVRHARAGGRRRAW